LFVVGKNSFTSKAVSTLSSAES